MKASASRARARASTRVSRSAKSPTARAWRLDPCASRPHHHRALALELGLDPPFEHVDHLEIDVVIVALRYFFRPARREEPDHVRPHHAVSGFDDAEIAVFGVAAQSALEIFFPVMAHNKALRPPRLGPHSRPISRFAHSRPFCRTSPRRSARRNLRLESRHEFLPCRV